MRYLRRCFGEPAVLSSWFSMQPNWRLPRKWRCFLAACCLRVKPYLGRSRLPSRLIEYAQEFVDRPPRRMACRMVRNWFGRGRCSVQAVRLLNGLMSSVAGGAGELRNISGHHARSLTAARSEKNAAQRLALDSEAVVQCGLIREVVGNPFRPIALDPAWLSPTCQKLASRMYRTRSFDRMSELALALAHAGCTNQQILDHCREPGSHARGCWVIDLILEKK